MSKVVVLAGNALACWGKVRQWLSQVDPLLRVRMRGEKAVVGGLAYSRWDGFAWLDCELTWPNRYRISRLEKLGIYWAFRLGMPWF